MSVRRENSVSKRRRAAARRRRLSKIGDGLSKLTGTADFEKTRRPRPVDPAAERARLRHNAANRAYKRRKRLDLVRITVDVPAFATPKPLALRPWRQWYSSARMAMHALVRACEM